MLNKHGIMNLPLSDDIHLASQPVFAAGQVTLLGSGSYLPGPAVDNQRLLEELEKHLGYITARKAGLICRRLGIEARHILRDFGQHSGTTLKSAPLMGNLAIENALADGGMSSPSASYQNLSYLIGHTTSPHTLLPPNIAWVAEELGHYGPFMELRQACTGFANGLQIAAAMLTADPSQKPVAIMGSELGSMYFDMSTEFVDQQQLVNLVQMGDGAAAVVLGADDGSCRQQISDIYTGQIGNHRQPGFQLQGGGSGQVNSEKGFPFFLHQVHKVQEKGRDLFLMGLRAIVRRGYELSDFAFILPHQVNGHLGRLFHQLTGLPEEKIIADAKILGNTGSAAIWLSLDKLRRSGRLQLGDKVLVLGAEATKYMYGGFVYQH